MRVSLDRRLQRSAALEGTYITASWALTGEIRPYRLSQSPNERGTFGPVSPRKPVGAGGFGAVEIVGRVSVTDLSASSDGHGGKLTGYAIGMNWIPHAIARFAIEAVRANTREKRLEQITVLLARTYLFF